MIVHVCKTLEAEEELRAVSILTFVTKVLVQLKASRHEV